MTRMTIEADQFYVVGGTLKEGAPSYVERDADRQLFEKVKAGDFCYVLTPRQMGKSSLMIRTAARLQREGILSVIVDLTQIGETVSPEQWYQSIGQIIVQRLGLRFDLVKWWAARAQFGPVHRLLDLLYQIVLGRTSEQVVIFVDEIDSTLKLPFDVDDFFAAIRSCYNRRATDSIFDRLAFVLLGVATPSDLIQDAERTPFNIGQRIDLTDFTLQEATPLGQALGHEPETNQRILEQIMRWTGGHPFLTQTFCHAIATSGQEEWSDEQVDCLVEKVFLSSGDAEEKHFGPLRRRIVEWPDAAELLSLYMRLLSGERRVADDKRSLVCNALKLSGLVKVRQDGVLQVRNRIYETVFDVDWAWEAYTDQTRDKVRLSDIYHSAAKALEEKDYQSCLDQLGLLTRLEPTYRVDEVREIRQQALQGRERQELMALYEYAVAQFRGRDFEGCLATMEEIRERQPDYPDREGIAEKARQAFELERRWEEFYQQGLKHESQGEWDAAVRSFERLHQENPEYEDVAVRLELAQSRTRWERFHKRARHLVERGAYSEGLNELARLAEIGGDYRASEVAELRQSVLNRMFAQAQRSLEEEQFEACLDFIAKLEAAGIDKRRLMSLIDEVKESLYLRGMWHFEHQEWWEAIVNFRRVKEMDRNYRDVTTVLEMAQDKNLLRRDYEVLGEIAVTGITRVYWARDRNGDLVAIKMLAPSYVAAHESWQLIETLRKGAELTQKLEHPCIVNVRGYEIRGWDTVGEYEDVHIVVMDYVEGKDLARVLNERKKLRVGEGLLIAERVCQALIHAHSRGVFHGDLKPSNILLTKDHQVKVTDFANAPYGTRSFRPPEQTRKGGEAIGAHTDIYALGQIVCKLVTGQAPFRAGDGGSRLPKGLERLVEKATRQEPEDRYRTAQEMLADIRKVKQSLWHHRFVEWSHGLVESQQPVLSRLGVGFAVLGVILLVILGAVLEPLVTKWVEEWRGGPVGTPTIVLYPAPALVSPEEGTSFVKEENVKLQWKWERELADNEFFEVRIRSPGQQEFAPMGQTRLSSQLVLASGLTQSGIYEWRVAIVSLSGEEKSVSQTWSFEVP